MLQIALAVLQESLPDDHRLLAGAQRDWGGYLTATGSYAEAEPLLLKRFEVLSTQNGDTSYGMQETLRYLVALDERWVSPTKPLATAPCSPNRPRLESEWGRLNHRRSCFSEWA